jgi:hypothetical protein
LAVNAPIGILCVPYKVVVMERRMCGILGKEEGRIHFWDSCIQRGSKRGTEQDVFVFF